jgi:hypothetical protein
MAKRRADGHQIVCGCYQALGRFPQLITDFRPAQILKQILAFTPTPTVKPDQAKSTDTNAGLPQMLQQFSVVEQYRNQLYHELGRTISSKQKHKKLIVRTNHGFVAIYN